MRKILKKLGISFLLVMSGFLMCMWSYELKRTDDYRALLVDHFNKGVHIEDCISVDEPGQVRVCLVRVDGDSYYVTKLDRTRVQKSDVIAKDVYYSQIKGVSIK